MTKGKELEISKAAELRGVDRKTVYRWTKDRKNPLRCHKRGRWLFVYEKDLLAYEPTKVGNPNWRAR